MAGNGLGDFDRRMRARGRQLRVGVDKIVRTVAIVADRELVLATPVDTGRARSNWVVSLGSPAELPIEAYVPGSKGSTSGANSQAATNQAQEEINRRQTEQDVYISNNVDYIEHLNNGSSAQAPAGFVQAAIKRAVDAVRNLRVFGSDRGGRQEPLIE